ncbi:uncharacterized protein [Aegilops tauschii subsp. strangulata]|uniref:uncharacterized protein n=1 Tax=Aegilops tauschii subsp. strangulata TaxID=200361 RepID=UPI003CC8D602
MPWPPAEAPSSPGSTSSGPGLGSDVSSLPAALLARAKTSPLLHLKASPSLTDFVGEQRCRPPFPAVPLLSLCFALPLSTPCFFCPSRSQAASQALCSPAPRPRRRRVQPPSSSCLAGSELDPSGVAVPQPCPHQDPPDTGHSFVENMRRHLQLRPRATSPENTVTRLVPLVSATSLRSPCRRRPLSDLKPPRSASVSASSREGRRLLPRASSSRAWAARAPRPGASPAPLRPASSSPAGLGPWLRFRSGVVRIRSTTSVFLLHGLVLLPSRISGKMTIPSKSLLSLLASCFALLLCRATYHLLYHASHIAMSSL